METRDSLKEVERRAYRTPFQDGFYEILWGTVFLLFAWIPVFESAGISRFYCYPSLLLLGLIPWLGKRYVTVPRLGAVEFGEKRKAKARYTALLGGAVIVLMLPVVIVMFAKGLPSNFTWMGVALVAAPVVAVGLLLLDYSKMFIYFALYLFSIAEAEFLLDYLGKPYNTFLAFGIPGIAIAGYGFYLLHRFLKEYPKPSAEATNVTR